jgi:hypothetical protein
MIHNLIFGIISLSYFFGIIYGQQQHDQHQVDCNRPEHQNQPECSPYYMIPTGSPTNYPTVYYGHYITDFGETKLYSPDAISDDFYGFSTAVWEDTVLIGAYATVSFGSNSGDATGSVFVYENYDDFSTRLLIPNVDQTYFGYSVAIWEGLAIIGAPRTDFQHCNDCGAAYLYKRFENGTWAISATLVANDYIDYHYLGYATAIWETFALVGAPGDGQHGQNTGAVYVFSYSNGVWHGTQKLSITNDNQEHGHHGEEFDHFGSAVAVYDKYAVIGAYGDDKNTGSAYVYGLQSYFYVALFKLSASDGGEGQYFGYSVAIYNGVVVVGAYNGHGHWYGAGCAYVFELASTGGFQQTASLWAHDGMSGDYFGFSVSIFQNIVLVGAHGEEGKGHEKQDEPPHLRRKLPGGGGGGGGGAPGEGGQHHEGENCGPNSPPDCKQYQGMYSYRGTGAGAAYVFRRSEGVWGQVMKIIPAYSEAYDHFGVSVSTYNEEFIIGADTADGVVDDTGAAYVYYPKFQTDYDKERQPTSGPVMDSITPSGGWFSNTSTGTATFAFLVVLLPVALGIAWWYVQSNKVPPGKDGLMQLPQDSRHGATVPWSMHGAFDESSWGLESSHSAANPNRSPLRAPANVIGR